LSTPMHSPFPCRTPTAVSDGCYIKYKCKYCDIGGRNGTLFVFLLIRYFGGYTDAQQQLNGELGHPHCLLMLFCLVWMESHVDIVISIIKAVPLFI